MQIYKLKHKPTGLYYKKHGFIAEKGSTYHSPLNALTHSKRDANIDIRISTKDNDKRKRYEAIMTDLYGKGREYTWKAKEWTVPCDDFEKEIIGELFT